MDDQGTWPTPLPAEGSSAETDFDRQVMNELRSDPQALREIGGVKGNVLIVLVPVVAVILLALAWWQFSASGSALWLAAMVGIVVVAAVVWFSRVKAVMNQARHVLGHHVVGSVGYGVGVIRQVRILDNEQHDTEDLDTPDLDTAGLDTVEVELTVAVSAVQGSGFTATFRQRYATLDALRLEVGQHGPVRYLRRNPQETTAIETRLEPEAVEQIYRGAAMN